MAEGTVMSDKRVPEQETSGGDKPDWRNAVPGQPLPEMPPDAYPEPDSTSSPRAIDSHEPEDGAEQEEGTA